MKLKLKKFCADKKKCFVGRKWLFWTIQSVFVKNTATLWIKPSLFQFCISATLIWAHAKGSEHIRSNEFQLWRLLEVKNDDKFFETRRWWSRYIIKGKDVQWGKCRPWNIFEICQIWSKMAKIGQKMPFLAVFCKLDPKNPQSHPQVTPCICPVGKNGAFK